MSDDDDDVAVGSRGAAAHAQESVSEFTAEDKKRQANGPGFYYQQLCTLLAWLELSDGETIKVEKHEDFDHVRPAPPDHRPLDPLTPTAAPRQQQAPTRERRSCSKPIATPAAKPKQPRKTKDAAAAQPCSSISADSDRETMLLECHQIKNTASAAPSESSLRNCLRATLGKLRDWRAGNPRMPYKSVRLVLHFNHTPEPTVLTGLLKQWHQLSAPAPADSATATAAVDGIATPVSPGAMSIEQIAHDLYKVLCSKTKGKSFRCTIADVMDLVQHTSIVLTTRTIDQTNTELQQACTSVSSALVPDMSPELVELARRSLLVHVIECAIDSATVIDRSLTRNSLRERLLDVQRVGAAVTVNTLTERCSKLRERAVVMGELRDNVLAALDDFVFPMLRGLFDTAAGQVTRAVSDRLDTAVAQVDQKLDRNADRMEQQMSEQFTRLSDLLQPIAVQTRSERELLYGRRFVSFDKGRASCFYDRRLTEPIPKEQPAPGFVDLLRLDPVEAHLLPLAACFGDRKTYCSFQATFFREVSPLDPLANTLMAKSVRYCLTTAGTLLDFVDRLASPEPHFDHLGSSRVVGHGVGVPRARAYDAFLDMARLLYTPHSLHAILTHQRHDGDHEGDLDDEDDDVQLTDLIDRKWTDVDARRGRYPSVVPVLREELAAFANDDELVLHVYFVCCRRHYTADALSDDIVFRLLPLLLQVTQRQLQQVEDTITTRPDGRNRHFNKRCAEHWSAMQIYGLIAPNSPHLNTLQHTFGADAQCAYRVLVNARLQVIMPRAADELKSWPVLLLPSSMTTRQVGNFSRNSSLHWLQRIFARHDTAVHITSSSSAMRLNDAVVLLSDDFLSWRHEPQAPGPASASTDATVAAVATAWLQLRYPYAVKPRSVTLRALHGATPKSFRIVSESGQPLGLSARFLAAADESGHVSATVDLPGEPCNLLRVELFGDSLIELDYLSVAMQEDDPAVQPMDMSDDVPPGPVSSSQDSAGDGGDSSQPTPSSVDELDSLDVQSSSGSEDELSDDPFLTLFRKALVSASTRKIIAENFTDESGADLLFILASEQLFNQFIRHCETARLFNKRRTEPMQVPVQNADAPAGSITVLLHMQLDADGHEQQPLIKVMVATLPRRFTEADSPLYFKALGVRAGACKVIFLCSAASIVDMLSLADVIVPRIVGRRDDDELSSASGAAAAAAAVDAGPADPAASLNLDSVSSLNFSNSDVRPAHIWFDQVVLKSAPFKDLLEKYSTTTLRARVEAANTDSPEAEIVVPHISEEIRFRTDASLVVVEEAEQSRLLGSDAGDAQLIELTQRNIAGLLTHQELRGYLADKRNRDALPVLLLAPVWQCRRHGDPQGHFQRCEAFQDHMRALSWRLLTAITRVAVAGESTLTRLQFMYSPAGASEPQRLLQLTPPLQDGVLNYSLQLPPDHAESASTLAVSLLTDVAYTHTSVSYAHSADIGHMNFTQHPGRADVEPGATFQITVERGRSSCLVVRVVRTLVRRYRIELQYTQPPPEQAAPAQISTSDHGIAAAAAATAAAPAAGDKRLRPATERSEQPAAKKPTPSQQLKQSGMAAFLTGGSRSTAATSAGASGSSTPAP